MAQAYQSIHNKKNTKYLNIFNELTELEPSSCLSWLGSEWFITVAFSANYIIDVKSNLMFVNHDFHDVLRVR